VDRQHCALLRRIADGRVKFHRHGNRSPRPRHDSDAHAPNRLGLVRNRDPRPVSIRRSSGRGCPPASRSLRRHELLRSCRRSGHGYAAKSQRRLAHPVAAFILVLRPSRGVHRHPPRHGRGIASSIYVLAQTDLRLSRHGLRHVRHRLPRLHGLGPSHVRQRHESLFRIRVLGPDHGHRRSLSHQNFQLARHHLERENPIHIANDVRARLRLAIRQRRPFRPVPGATSGG
jgi:hypothetical protein